MAVLDTDLLTCADDEILDAHVTATWMGGRCVFEAYKDRKRPKMAREAPSVSAFLRNRRVLGMPLGALCVYNVSAAESMGAALEAPLV